MDKKKIKKTEDLLFEYFQMSSVRKVIIGNVEVRISYYHTLGKNMVTLYANVEPFFQTRNYRKLKKMLKVLFYE